MSTEHKSTIKKVFITGLLVLIPIAATTFVLVFFFNLLKGWLAPAGVQILYLMGIRLPEAWQQLPGFALGILTTLILIFITGVFASNFLGRRILQIGDQLIRSIPLVSSIYSAMRQVVNSFSVTGASAFKTVVMFEYPRKGLWAMGFMTTFSLPCIQKAAKQKVTNVFLPTTPNPTSGYLLMVPTRDLRVLPISPEEALKIIATVGLIQKGQGSQTALAAENSFLGAENDRRDSGSDVDLKPVKGKRRVREKTRQKVKA